VKARILDDSRGQTLALFAVFAPVLLAVVGLGLDGAQIFLERRNAQVAADLAALSGAVELLESDATGAKAKARATAAANDYPVIQVNAVSPYLGRTDQIEVTVTSSVRTHFLPVLGILGLGDFSTFAVTARAVAQSGYEGATSGGFAIFGLQACPTTQKVVDFSGSIAVVTGAVHSNTDVYFSGSNNEVEGETTYVSGCGFPAFVNGGSGNDFEETPASTTVQPDPIALARTDFTCDFLAPSTGMWDLSNNGAWWVGGTKASKTLRPGTYCSRGTSGSIKLGDSDIRIEDVIAGNGGVTFVAHVQVEISGSNFDLHPHEHGILFAAYGNSDTALKLSGSGGDWQGSMYSPNGTAEVSGSSNLNIAGSIVGERVKINGSNFNINGDGGEGGAGPQQLALVE
jgi:Flp pilus assembly protein TadG